VSSRNAGRSSDDSLIPVITALVVVGVAGPTLWLLVTDRLAPPIERAQSGLAHWLQGWWADNWWLVAFWVCGLGVAIWYRRRLRRLSQRRALRTAGTETVSGGKERSRPARAPDARKRT
jgi:hypothetical protein